ncbi:MAG: CDP-archaeol synthase [Bacillota bacterium]|nr:CDP-archaeol synthase [Bacillota bacterium]
MAKEKNLRYLGVLILLPLIIFLFIGGIYLKYVLLIVSFLGMYEIYKNIKLKGINAVDLFGYALCITYFLTLNESADFQFITLVLIVSVLCLLCLPVLNTKYTYIDVAVTVVTFIYVPVFFSFIYLVDTKAHGNLLIWFIFIGAWLCDILAYYSGRVFGKHKLCPEVSAKKTIEGSIGGLVGSILGCGIYGIIINNKLNHIPVFHFFIIGLLCGIFCQFGDLAASSIKRFAGVKDYSNLIPGHGGILDRFDSILFASVVVYYYITFIMGM